MIIFSDDTSFSLDKSRESFGIGCLILNHDNTQQIIDEALNSLAKDPEAKADPKDQRTLGRKWFHASEDSKNAHSWLCRSINKHLKAEFEYGYVEVPKESKGLATAKNLEFLTVLASSSKKPVRIIIEQSSEISQQRVKTISEKVYSAISWGAYQAYAIPKFFPLLDISIVDKKNSGIQVVDFLLWAHNRKFAKPSRPQWYERLERNSPVIEMNVEGKGWVQGSTYFQDVLLENNRWPKIYPANIFPLPEFSGTTELIQLFTLILEKVVYYLNLIELPESVAHFSKIRDDLRTSLIKNKFVMHAELLELISVFYVRIFDTLPIWEESDLTDIPKMQMFLKTKRLAGLIQRKDLAHSMTTKMFLNNNFRNCLTPKMKIE